MYKNFGLIWFGVWCVLILAGCDAAYFGKSLGKLSEFHHGVSGHVYAVDGRTLFIKDFTYDGEGPAAYFYVGNTKSPSNNGALRLRDERGSTGVLKKYRGKDITLTLPEGKTFNSIKWFSVWCDEFSVNFGDVKIPRNLDFPKPQKISGLAGVHGVSSDPIVIVDAQTLLIPNFSYDGEAPDAKFWVGRGDKPSPQGIKIPDENGKVKPLRKYDHKTIVLTLPDDLTVFDIGHFGVWCEAFTVDFGHVIIPQVTNVPPSLKMLGVSPQKRNQELLSSTPSAGHSSLASSGVRLQNQENLKPTTYRPPTSRFSTGANLEPLGRFQIPLNVNDAVFQQFYPVAASAIHRRADNFQPAFEQQLLRNDFKNNIGQNNYFPGKSAILDQPLIQASREIYVNHEPLQRQEGFYNQIARTQPQQVQQQQIHQQPLQYYQQQQQPFYQPQQFQQNQQIYQQQQIQQPQQYQQFSQHPQVYQQQLNQQHLQLNQQQLRLNQQQSQINQQQVPLQVPQQRLLLQNQPQYQTQNQYASFQGQQTTQNLHPLYQTHLVHPRQQIISPNVVQNGLERRRYDLDLDRGHGSLGPYYNHNTGIAQYNSFV